MLDGRESLGVDRSELQIDLHRLDLDVLDRTPTEHVRDRRWLRAADDPEPGVSVGSETIVDSGKRFSERGALCERSFGRCRLLVGR